MVPKWIVNKFNVKGVHEFFDDVVKGATATKLQQ